MDEESGARNVDDEQQDVSAAAPKKRMFNPMKKIKKLFGIGSKKTSEERITTLRAKSATDMQLELNSIELFDEPAGSSNLLPKHMSLSTDCVFTQEFSRFPVGQMLPSSHLFNKSQQLPSRKLAAVSNNNLPSSATPTITTTAAAATTTAISSALETVVVTEHVPSEVAADVQTTSIVKDYTDVETDEDEMFFDSTWGVGNRNVALNICADSYHVLSDADLSAVSSSGTTCPDEHKAALHKLAIRPRNRRTMSVYRSYVPSNATILERRPLQNTTNSCDAGPVNNSPSNVQTELRSPDTDQQPLTIEPDQNVNRTARDKRRDDAVVVEPTSAASVQRRVKVNSSATNKSDVALRRRTLAGPSDLSLIASVSHSQSSSVTSQNVPIGSRPSLKGQQSSSNAAAVLSSSFPTSEFAEVFSKFQRQMSHNAAGGIDDVDVAPTKTNDYPTVVTSSDSDKNVTTTTGSRAVVTGHSSTGTFTVSSAAGSEWRSKTLTTTSQVAALVRPSTYNNINSNNNTANITSRSSVVGSSKNLPSAAADKSSKVKTSAGPDVKQVIANVKPTPHVADSTSQAAPAVSGSGSAATRAKSTDIGKQVLVTKPSTVGTAGVANSSRAVAVAAASATDRFGNSSSQGVKSTTAGLMTSSDKPIDNAVSSATAATKQPHISGLKLSASVAQAKTTNTSSSGKPSSIHPSSSSAHTAAAAAPGGNDSSRSRSVWQDENGSREIKLTKSHSIALRAVRPKSGIELDNSGGESSTDQGTAFGMRTWTSSSSRGGVLPTHGGSQFAGMAGKSSTSRSELSRNPSAVEVPRPSAADVTRVSSSSAALPPKAVKNSNIGSAQKPSQTSAAASTAASGLNVASSSKTKTSPPAFTANKVSSSSSSSAPSEPPWVALAQQKTKGWTEEQVQ